MAHRDRNAVQSSRAVCKEQNSGCSQFSNHIGKNNASHGLCWSGGIGRRTRLKIWRCLTAWGFNSPLQHIKCEVSRFVAQKDDLSGLLELFLEEDKGPDLLIGG